MKANCWKCGAGFKFDEAKVQKRARVKCPVCSAKMTLEQDPNSPEPLFFVVPMDESAKKDQEKKEESEKGALDIDRSNLVSEELLKDAGQYQDSRFTEWGGKHQVSEKSLDVARVTREIPISESSFSGRTARPEKKPGERESITLTTSDTEGMALEHKITVPKTSERSSPAGSSKPRLEKESFRLDTEGGNRVVWALIFLFFIGILVTGYLLLFHEGLDKAGGGNKEPSENAILNGQKIIQGFFVQEGRPTDGDPLQLMKEAELAFQKDLPHSYRKALGSFRRALVLNQDNPELVVRYVESYIRVHGRPRNMTEIQNLFDLIEYGQALSPNLASLHRAKALVLLSIGQIGKAEKEAEFARRMEPHNSENVVVSAETLVGSNPERAAGFLEDLLDKADSPKSAILHYAEAKLAMGRFAKAEEAFQRREVLDPGACALCGGLGEMYTSLGLYKDAELIYRRFIKKRSDSPTGHLGLAYVNWLSGGSPKKSLEILERINEKIFSYYSLFDQVLVLKARSHYALLAEEFGESIRSSEKAYELDPMETLSLYHKALALTNSEDLFANNRNEIKKYLDMLILDFPEQPEVWTLRAVFFKKIGDLKNSIEFLKRAIIINRHYYHANFLLAQLYLEALNADQAFSTIEAMAKYYPDYWRDHPDANLFTDMFAYEDKLIDDLSKMDDSKVDTDRKNLAIGLVLYLLGKSKEAERLFNEVLQNHERNVTANLYMAHIGYHGGNLSLAKKHLARLLEGDRNHALANVLQSRILLKQGKQAKAIRRLERLIVAKRANASSLALLSELMDKNKRFEEARELADKAYKMDPDALQIRRARYHAYD